MPGGLGELEVKIISTRGHYLDFVGLDNSTPRPVMVQEASLVSAMLNGEEDVTDILLEGNGDMVTIVSGEHIILTFEFRCRYTCITSVTKEFDIVQGVIDVAGGG